MVVVLISDAVIIERMRLRWTLSVFRSFQCRGSGGDELVVGGTHEFLGELMTFPMKVFVFR